MKELVVLVVMNIFSLFFVSESFAQRGMKWKGSRGWGPGSQYNMMKTVPLSGLVGEKVN